MSDLKKDNASKLVDSRGNPISQKPNLYERFQVAKKRTKAILGSGAALLAVLATVITNYEKVSKFKNSIFNSPIGNPSDKSLPSNLEQFTPPSEEVVNAFVHEYDAFIIETNGAESALLKDNNLIYFEEANVLEKLSIGRQKTSPNLYYAIRNAGTVR